MKEPGQAWDFLGGGTRELGETVRHVQSWMEGLLLEKKKKNYVRTWPGPRGVPNYTPRRV